MVALLETPDTEWYQQRELLANELRGLMEAQARHAIKANAFYMPTNGWLIVGTDEESKFHGGKVLEYHLKIQDLLQSLPPKRYSLRGVLEQHQQRTQRFIDRIGK